MKWRLNHENWWYRTTLCQLFREALFSAREKRVPLTATTELMNVCGLYNKDEQIVEELLYVLVFVWSR